MERLTRVGVPVGVAGAVEGQHADVVHADVVGVRVAAAPRVGIADDHLRVLVADDPDEAADGFVEVGVGEVLGVGVVLGVGHARVAVAEQVELVVADDPDTLGELEHPHRADVLPCLRAVGLLVQDVAGLATGARDENRADPLSRVPGHRGGPFRGLVVGMGVDGEHAQPGTVVCHGFAAYPGPSDGPCRLCLTYQASADYHVNQVVSPQGSVRP